MAVTIHTSPQLYTPSDNPITWVFSSDETAEANFSYLVELYINGVLDSRHLVFPERGARSHFDASERMKAFTPSAQLNTSLVNDASNISTVYIKVIERYGTPPTNQANATSSTVNSFKACLSDSEFSVWDYTDYLTSFFTDYDRDNLNLYNSNVRQYYQFLTNNRNNLALSYQRFDASGVAIGAVVTTAIANTIKIAQFNVRTLTSIWSLNNVAYIELKVIDTALVTDISEVLRLNIVTPDTCYLDTYLIWLNKFGAFDQYMFLHNLISRTEIQKLEYQSQFGQWVGTDFVYSTATSGNKSYVKTMQDSGSIVSDWISEVVQSYIVKLYESPYVVIQIGLTTYYQIVVNNSSYEIKQEKYEELFNEIIEFSRSNTRKSINL